MLDYSTQDGDPAQAHRLSRQTAVWDSDRVATAQFKLREITYNAFNGSHYYAVIHAIASPQD